MSSNAFPRNNNNDLLDSRVFIAPRAILEMYQKVSFSSFKVWASLLADISDKDFSEEDQFVPLSAIWQALDGRLSYKRLEVLLEELQTTLIKQDEYLPQTFERKRSSFHLLGPTEITVNQSNDVTSLKYRLVRELLQILKTEGNKEQFIIEMRTFISLKGKGGEHAKNLVLFCTPYIGLGETKYIDVNQLREFMGLGESYNDDEGNTIFKTFKRDVLKHAINAIEANPYVNFQIEGIDTQRVGKRISEIKFILTERRSIKNLLSKSMNDHSSPADPTQLKSTLISFWQEETHNVKNGYPIEVIYRLLKQFKLVDKYINEIINERQFNTNPKEETYRIFSISTAVTQLWLDGQLSKEDSKIYNYAYRIFKTPNDSKVESLCKKFISTNGLYSSSDITQAEILKKQKSQRAARAKLLINGINQYSRNFIKRAFSALTSDEISRFNEEFIKLCLTNKFGPWPKKAILKLEVRDCVLANVLTKRALALYNQWISEKCVELDIIPAQSVSDFLNRHPEQNRHITFLNVPTNINYSEFVSFVELLKSK